MKYRKKGLLTEGKTKKIWGVTGYEEIVIVEHKDTITKFDDPKHTKQFAAKAAYSTTTTCRVFELLQKAGIPIAYKEQISPTEFLAQKCDMIPLEVVARRFAVGSFLKRHPNFTPEEIQAPHLFRRLVIEFFLKTTKGQLLNPDGKVLLKGLDPEKGEEDPFILNPYNKDWQLFHSKKPAWDPQANLNRTVKASLVVHGETQKEMENILRKVFLVLEGAWNTLGLHFIDMKIEFGVDVNTNNLLVADVI
ncbi:hypothetical protein KA005_43150, partial [bacterium]|nr:hypothetical protein [bacterium]